MRKTSTLTPAEIKRIQAEVDCKMTDPQVIKVVKAAGRESSD